MGSKRRCPACGAKNEMTVRRCRVCTVVINPDVPEGGPVVEEPAPAPALTDHFDAGVIDRQMQSARSKFGGGSGALAARLAAANGGALPSSYAIAPTPAGSTPAAPDASEARVAPSPPEREAPLSGAWEPAPPDEEPFDPDALFRDLG